MVNNNAEVIHPPLCKHIVVSGFCPWHHHNINKNIKFSKIYEGEEIGMTNAFFDKIEDYRDVEALDIFKDFTGRKGFSVKDTLELLRLKSRDNARTRCSGVRKKMPDFLRLSCGLR